MLRRIAQLATFTHVGIGTVLHAAVLANDINVGVAITLLDTCELKRGHLRPSEAQSSRTTRIGCEKAPPPMRSPIASQKGKAHHSNPQ